MFNNETAKNVLLYCDFFFIFHVNLSRGQGLLELACRLILIVLNVDIFKQFYLPFLYQKEKLRLLAFLPQELIHGEPLLLEEIAETRHREVGDIVKVFLEEIYLPFNAFVIIIEDFFKLQFIQ